MKLFLILPLLFLSNCIYAQKPVIIEKSTLDSLLPYVNIVKSEWIFAAKSVDKNEFFIRDSYVSKDEGEIKIWVKIIYTTYTFKNKIYKNAYKLLLCTFDYANTKMKVTSETNYSAKGNVITPFNTGEQIWQEIVPDSVFEAVYKKTLEVFIN